MRNDDAFNKLFFQLVESFHEKKEATLPRKCKAPRCLEIGEGEGYHSATIEEQYCQKYFEALNFSNYWNSREIQSSTNTWNPFF